MGEKKKQYLIYSAVGIILFGILAVRLFYGLGFADEFCYLASLKRYIQGDRFLLDDWHPPTQLTSWLLYRLVGLMPGFYFTMIGSRLVYLIFQFIIGAVMFFCLRRDKGRDWAVLIYLLSIPYNIPGLSYNTVSIGAFMLFCALMTGAGKKKLHYAAAGILLAVAGVCNPYLVFFYGIYAAACLIKWIVDKKRHREKDDRSILGPTALGWVTLGAGAVGLLFIVSLLGKGSITEYRHNIAAILGDAEHSENRNLLLKLLQSQYQIVRVYWRAAVPMGLIGGATLAGGRRLSQRIRNWLYLLSCLVTIYGTIHFAFIYGSVYINLLLVPMAFLGIEVWLLQRCEGRTERTDRYFLWLLAGWLFAACDFLGTNTEILSMSAMFIVPSTAAVLLNMEYASLPEAQNVWGNVKRYAGRFTAAVLIFCALYQRIFFVWFDGPLLELNTRIEFGPAKGVYTTEAHALEYTQLIQGIDLCGITEEDKVLFLPIDSFEYYYSDGEIATPYITRFQIDVNELSAYFTSHPHKMPTKVVITDSENGEFSEEENLVIDWFLEHGYRMEWVTDTICMLAA